MEETYGSDVGVTTAGHCSNTVTYGGEDLDYQVQLDYDYWDIQWHEAPDFTPEPKIRYNENGDTRPIYDEKHRDDMVLWSYLCQYGKTTGYDCGYITSKDYQQPSIGHTHTSTFIVAGDGGVDMSEDGDSGGPWFLGNTAYGSHVDSYDEDEDQGVFMAINYMENLSVDLMLDTP